MPGCCCSLNPNNGYNDGAINEPVEGKSRETMGADGNENLPTIPGERRDKPDAGCQARFHLCCLSLNLIEESSQFVPRHVHRVIKE